MEKFSDRKPIPVVKMATVMPSPWSANARRAHSVRSAVCCIVWRIDDSIWTLLATANVITISGATAVAELIGMRVQPSAPSETSADSAASTRISSDPVTVRSRMPTTSNIATSMAGVSVSPSFWLAVANAWLIATDPLALNSISGYSAR